jgi:hypothetical protein
MMVGWVLMAAGAVFLGWLVWVAAFSKQAAGGEP